MKNYILTVVTVTGLRLPSKPRPNIDSSSVRDIAHMLMYDLRRTGTITFMAENDMAVAITADRVDYLLVELVA